MCINVVVILSRFCLYREFDQVYAFPHRRNLRFLLLASYTYTSIDTYRKMFLFVPEKFRMRT
jgi:hypothetical protein